jgi:hypothetical protein
MIADQPPRAGPSNQHATVLFFLTRLLVLSASNVSAEHVQITFWRWHSELPVLLGEYIQIC